MPSSASSPVKRVVKLLRRVLISLVLLLIVCLAVRAWLMQGLFLPIRIVGGSMVGVILGSHWDVKCEDCGIQFPCGVENPPAVERAVCPNCGYGGNRVQAARLVRGDRVLINKTAFAFRRPRRWEVAVIHPPGYPRQLAVKRVVGLPGERISIWRGDIYINGRIARKSLDQLRGMALLVHDARYRTSKKNSLPPRWQADAEDSGWHIAEGGFVFHTQPAQAEEQTAGDDFDWLTYRHWRCMPTPHGRTDESPVLDHYGYNQGLSRQLNQAADLMLVCRLSISTATERVALRVHDGSQTFQVELGIENNKLLLKQNDRVVIEKPAPIQLMGQHQVELAVCDRRLLLALDGKEALSYPYEPSEEPWQGTSRPLAIGAGGPSLEVHRLKIFRDIHYLDPLHRGSAWTLDRPMDEDEYFLLGDNCPISVDSRHWKHSGQMRSRHIIGGLLKRR